MQVVFDTNIIYGNWYLEGPNFLVLERLIRLGKCRLVVPEIVILESINKFKDEMSSHVKAIDNLNRLIPDKSKAITRPDINQLSEDYQIALSKRLEELATERPSHTDIPQADIVSRSLDYRKPFSQSDRGYRDTLLWEVILRKVASATHTTFLITNNRRDFGRESGENQLHTDLMQDIKSRDLPEESMRLYTTLKQWVDEYGLPSLEQFAMEVAEDLKDGEYQSFSISAWFIDNRDHFIEAINSQIGDVLSTYHELEDPEVRYIEEPEEITVEDVSSLDENTIYLDTQATAYVTVSVFVHRMDYDWVSDKYPLVLPDYDWSKHHVFADLFFKLPIRFSAIFNISHQQIEQFEVDPIEIWGWCRFCGAIILSDAAEECYECGKSFA